MAIKIFLGSLLTLLVGIVIALLMINSPGSTDEVEQWGCT